MLSSGCVRSRLIRGQSSNPARHPCEGFRMTVFQSLIFLALFVPVVAIAIQTVLEAHRDPDRERPMITGETWGTGDFGGGGGGGDGGGG